MTLPSGGAIFPLFRAQLEGGALGALALGGGAVAAAHLDGVQGAAVLGPGMVGAGVYGTLDAGITGLLVVHDTKPSLFRMALVCGGPGRSILWAAGIFCLF